MRALGSDDSVLQESHRTTIELTGNMKAENELFKEQIRLQSGLSKVRKRLDL